jgi:putative hydrolase of the HAD superfamily
MAHQEVATSPADAGPRYRAVLFDLFGTLSPCYPLEGVRLTIREMAADLDLPPDAFESAWSATFAHRQSGAFRSLEENIRHVLGELEAERDLGLIASAAERRLRFEAITIQPRSDVLETLGGLRAAGVRIGLISNCSIETPCAWPGAAFGDAIDSAVFSCHAGCAKPDPQIYARAARDLDVSPSDCLFVGDGSSDELAGALACGMGAILIRAEDDDDTFPGRIAREDWPGPIISSISEVYHLVVGGPRPG